MFTTGNAGGEPQEIFGVCARPTPPGPCLPAFAEDFFSWRARWRSSLLPFAARKDVIDVVVGGKDGLVERACLHPLDDFFVREIEDRLQDLGPLLLVGLPHDE